MTKRQPKIVYNVDLPEGVKLSKRPVKQPAISEYERLPLTKMYVGGSFYVKGRNARSLRGILFKKPRNRNMKFISRTSKSGSGVRVWRIK